MKFRYLFSAFAASLVLLSGCAKEESVGSLDNIELSDTFLSIKAEGGSVGLTITATEDWAFQTIDKTWPEVVSEKDGQEVRTPSWLSVDKMSGTSGQTKVTFSAEATETGRELSLSIKVGTNMQFLKVRQGSLDPVSFTCKDIEDGKATVGASYKMAGKVVQLGSTSKGGFYINDGTSTKNAQVYSSTDESKAAFPNVEVGDYVEFSGTWSSYKNFEDAEISKLKKALVVVIDKTVNVDEKGGEIEVKVAYKGNGVFFDEPESDWVSYVGMSFKKGVPDKLISNPADTALVKYSILPNRGENKRNFTLNFSSYSADESSEDTAEIVQAGSRVPSSIAELNASITTEEEPAEPNFKVNLKDAVISYANGASAFIEDETGGTIYFNWDKKLEAGKKINGVVTGKAYLYNGFVEIVDIDLSQATVEDIEGGVSPTVLTIKDLLANYSRWQHCYVKLENVTFTTAITPSIRNGKISQGDSEIAVYAQVKNKLDMSGTGDLVCLPTSYKGNPQVGVYENSQFTKK